MLLMKDRLHICLSEFTFAYFVMFEAPEGLKESPEVGDIVRNDGRFFTWNGKGWLDYGPVPDITQEKFESVIKRMKDLCKQEYDEA